MAVSITIDITLNSQSIANNTSNVTVKVNAKWTGGSYNLLEKSGHVTIDGTKYNFVSSFNTGRTTSGVGTLYSRTLNITHNSDGTKTLKCSASYTSGVSSGTVAASCSKALTTIPRKSTLSVANGTLGTAQTLTVTRQSTSFTHTITYSCGSASGTICSKSTSTSISFTPPLSLASQNTTGTSVSIKYTITTYNGNTNVGSNSYTKTYSIPSNVKPECTITVTDSTGYKDLFGAFVQGLSKFAVTVNPHVSYGSAIASYSVSANGSIYTKASFTTDILKSSGSLSVSATVKDKRGRTGSATVTNLIVLPYSKPAIANLSAKRCNEDGTLNPGGSHVKVVFDSAITPLNNKNAAAYKLAYKETSGSVYTEVDLNDISGIYEAEGVSCMFAADASVSYDVKVIAIDSIYDMSYSTTVSSSFKFMSWRPGGRGLAFGKIAELDDTVEFEFDAQFNGRVCGNVFGLNRLPEIPPNSDFNDYMETGCWAVYRNTDAETMTNIPVTRAGRLEVSSATGEGIRSEQWSYLRQRYIPYNSTNAVWEREMTRGEDNVWHYYEWWRSSLTPIASEKVYSKAAMTIALSGNTTLGIVNTYTKVPLNKNVLSTSDRLTLVNGSIRIGANIQYVKVSGQTLVKCGSVTGNRHAKIQKVSSGGTVTSVAWSCVYGVATSNTVYSLSPAVVSVAEGDTIQIVFYTSDATDMNASGSAAGGWQTYLTVEEL